MRGRPAKPTKLKLLDGDRESRINRAEPIPTEQDVRPPGFLSPEARDVWERIAPDRIGKGVLTAWDVEAFAAFCEALVLLQSSGRESRDPPVPFAASPVAQFKNAVLICSTLGSRFGWTPADRAKLSMRSDEDAGKGAERLLG